LKPTLPKGTRDFLPSDIKKRDYIFSIIKEQFNIFGYDAIETPAMESLDTLSGNYGEEGDRLLFKVLNNGDYLKDVPADLLAEKLSNKVTGQISKRGLRYDLTVPFARFLVMNRQHIKFPFKRSAIQPVWRADKPQRGRYQEFYQCDADVAGSDSLIYEAELICLYDVVFKELGLPVDIRWNNRKILSGIVETAGLEDHFNMITIIIDKLDKIGEEGVKRELIAKDFPADSVDRLLYLITLNELAQLESEMKSETGLSGISELKTVLSFLKNKKLANSLIFDPKLARGLSYYTGCIFEVVAKDANMGSIGGGGRYDNLTSVFGLNDVSGVGISFGVERIYDVMEEKSLFPDSFSRYKNLLIACIEDESFDYASELLFRIRDEKIPADIYPKTSKLQKQMSYANEAGYAYVAVIGGSEKNSSTVTLKDMDSGKQQTISYSEMVKIICKK